MSEERVCKTLEDMGFSDAETKIYLYLSKKGQQKGHDIALSLKINKQQLYPSLKNLQNKGIVSQTLEHPARFNALSFEKVLDLYLKTKIEEVRRIEQSKDQILNDWQSIVIDAAQGQSDRFMVFEGRSRIYSTLENMIRDSKLNLQAIASVNGLRKVNATGLFETAQPYLLKSQVNFNLLLDIANNEEDMAEKLVGEITRGQKNLEVRSPILPLKGFPTLLIKDNEEILLFIKPLGEPLKDDVCLWTNCKSIINAFDIIFRDLWRNSTLTKFDVSVQGNEEKIIYQSPNELAERIEKARKEVFFLTSVEGLTDLLTNHDTLANLAKKGVAIKILAPINHNNFETAKLLSEYSKLKHVPENTVEAVIIDREHLFQTQHNTSKDKSRSLIYSKSPEYIKQMKQTLDEMWETSQEPSNVTLQSISGPYGYNPYPLANENQDKLVNKKSQKYYYTLLNAKTAGAVSEQEILNKIINGKKYAITEKNKVNVMYASAASSIIHPPEYFKLPRMLIHINHIEKKSSLGEADVLEVHLWLDTPKGPRFVPMGGLGDNAQGVLHRKRMYAGTPFENNHQLVNKDQLEVRVYGNTLFAGWTVPIKLSPWDHALPPGCILIEGYGNVKSSSITVISPMGVKVDREQNWFDAFVTFMHPASKYSGPGTDGLFARDLIVTMTPP